MNKKNIIPLLILMWCSIVHAQMDQYQYKREISNINDRWHRIELSDAVLSKVSQSLSDIRIFGIRPNKDTIEVPYLLNEHVPQVLKNEMQLSVMNKSHNNKGYYYTIEVKDSQLMNELVLDFKRDNFDWQVTLEGGHDQKEWFTIVDNYRIVSIKNDWTDYSFTKILFQPSKYQYLRLHVHSAKNPRMRDVKVMHKITQDGSVKHFKTTQLAIKEDNHTKQSEIIVQLSSLVRASSIAIKVKDDIDYYRPVRIQYLSDSTKTETGWIYHYKNLASSTLSSLEQNEFFFGSTTLQQLKIIVKNFDNEPLEIESIEVKGYQYDVLARFTVKANYYLCYGNEKGRSPIYDIVKFKDRMPPLISNAEVGEECAIIKAETVKKKPLFNNYWLWSILVVVMALLFWFALKMMKDNKAE